MNARIVAAVERAVGSALSAWRPVAGGYTAAGRWLATMEDDRTVFVKVGTEELSRQWLRDEHQAYLSIGAELRPMMIGWDDDGEFPVLVLEDLSDGFTVPPWTPEKITAVHALLDRIAGTPAPSAAPRLADYDFPAICWGIVESDPEPFLSLRLCSPGWLDAHLPLLARAVLRLEIDADSLVHFDVRSDNICFRDGQALLVDWNGFGRGHPLLDLAAWLPSLTAEGGPLPDEIFPRHPDASGLASLVAGFFAARAGLPPPPTAAESLRALQLAQLEVALPWAARELGLPPPLAQRS